MKLEGIAQAIEKWLSDSTGLLVVRPKHLDAPTPVPGYAQWNIISMTGKAMDADVPHMKADDLWVEHVGLREFTVSVQVVSTPGAMPGDALLRLNAARNALERNDVAGIFKVANIAPVDPGPVQNNPVLLETMWSQRATMDVRFLVADGTDERTGYFDHTQLISNLQ